VLGLLIPARDAEQANRLIGPEGLERGHGSTLRASFTAVKGFHPFGSLRVQKGLEREEAPASPKRPGLLVEQ
jgi:hypothetical protein